MHVDVNVCSKAVGPLQVHCDSRVRTDTRARTARPARAGQAHLSDLIGNNGAYDPGYLQSAYNVADAIYSGSGTGQVVAIVDAYDDPNIVSDMASFRGFFLLPDLPECTTWPSATACFRKVNQSGAVGPYPAPDPGWAQKIALDVDMVSAICPSCSILLVEANSNGLGDLSAAVNEAVLLGANVVSNSYGAGEWSGEAGLDSAFNHQGVAITVSSGDAGYGTEWPAASPYVTAVGGTSLTQTTSTGSRNGSETAWSGAGSGCSAYEPKPEWQTDAVCAARTVADVSAVADPNTGVWIYDSYGNGGWAILGGTSVAAPIVGAVYALAGNSRSSNVQMSSNPYGHLTALFDATGGSNGSCGGTYLCTGSVGYDGPTGLGTPNGPTAFVTVVAADFSLVVKSSSLKVTHGASVNDALTLNAIHGYHSSVHLTISGLPTGVTASFSANPVTPTASPRLTLRATSSAKRGVYALTLSAAGADGTVHTQALQLTVQ